MLRSVAVLLACTALAAADCGGDDEIANCAVSQENAGLYELEFELVIPAECPVPLANPGIEKKYAAAKIWDRGTEDMYYASVKVRNSAGKEVESELTIFLRDFVGNRYAVPRAEFVAASGAGTFTDTDLVTFHASSQTGNKLAQGRTTLRYRQTTLSTRLVGEKIPPPNTTQTWSAPVTGGYPGFTYAWYRDGMLVGSSPTYTGTVGTGDSNLRVEVTDQTWSTVAAVLSLNVGGIEATIDGPTVVYASQGAQTWSATARGGTGTYTFDWYLDDIYAGSGITWSSYPGENWHRLEVRAQDSAGEFDAHALNVHGFGDNDPGCQPVPPQLTCGPS
ncbi:MAG TPA: hypothetical protein VF647_22185 [Longimicrobium sp.]|jgi:hypothetical protein